MGVIDRQTGNRADAKEMLTHAVRLIPEHFDAQYNLGIVLMDAGEAAEARVHLEKRTTRSFFNRSTLPVSGSAPFSWSS